MHPLLRRRHAGVVSVALALLAPIDASSAQAVRPTDAPPPAPPDVISRVASGQVTVRAIKLSEPLRVDGVLDEDVYKTVKPFGGLVQVAPDYGKTESEVSELWITYDTKNIYLTCRCHDKSPPDEWVVNELRRDTNGLRNNEHIGILFDTFYDRRSGFAFYTNPLGARADYSVVDEGGSNTDWNPVWTSRTGRFDGGWIVEMAIPLKSLRYRAGDNQVWGIQIRRSIRHKNEWLYLTPVPRILAGPQALNRVSSGGTLVGLDLPPAGKNIELKPYVIGRMTTDHLRVPKLDNSLTGSGGGDVKYALTPNLTADVTLNTDFAQVEIDEQQTNLTRFNLFFPEKRDFFLEGRGIFEFARGGQGISNSDQSDTPYLFYSRRIGLNSASGAPRVVPINGGGRLTGKVGPWAVGLMDIQTRENLAASAPATNFGVARIKRDVFRNGAVGAMATSRSVGPGGTGTNAAFGLDGTFSLTQDLRASGYWARTSTTGKSGDDDSYQGLVDYAADKYGAHAEYLSVGANFDPQVGFLRRAGFNRSFASVRYSPRPTAVIPAIRKLTWTNSVEYIENSVGALDARGLTSTFNTEFNNSDAFTVTATRDHEDIAAAFRPSGSPALIGVGAYTYSQAAVSYTFGSQRRASGMVQVMGGQYYDGTIRSLTIGAGGSGMQTARVSINTHFAIEPTFTISSVQRSAGNFTTRIARARLDYAFSPLMFASGLFQFSSADRTVASNLRFRWEYAPGSEIFLVYTDERDTDPALATPSPGPVLRNRVFVIKVNRLFRY